MIWFASGLMSLLLSAAQGQGLQRYEYRRMHMGTEFHLILYAPDPESGLRAAEAAFARVEHLDRVMSDFREDSELSLVNRHAYEAPVVVSPELFEILLRSREIWAATEGAFDVTVGPLTRIWRQARLDGRAPDPETIEKLRETCGMEKVLLNRMTRSVRLTNPRTRLDLGAIGKGFAADEVLRLLAQLGLDRALVDAGGDLVAGEAPPNRSGWTVGIAETGRKLTLRHRAAATSGNWYQRIDDGERRLSHVLDPRTGFAVESDRQVTVIAPDGTTADALATAFSVLTVEESQRVSRRFESIEVLSFLLAERQADGSQGAWLDRFGGIGETRIPGRGARDPIAGAGQRPAGQ